MEIEIWRVFIGLAGKLGAVPDDPVPGLSQFPATISTVRQGIGPSLSNMVPADIAEVA